MKRGRKNKSPLHSWMTKSTRANLRRFREFIYATFPTETRVEQNTAKRLADEVGSESARNIDDHNPGATFESEINTFHQISSIKRYGNAEAEEIIGVDWEFVKQIERKFPELLIKLGFANNMEELRKLSEPPFLASNKAMKEISGYDSDISEYPTAEEALCILVKLNVRADEIWPDFLDQFPQHISLLEKVACLLMKHEEVSFSLPETFLLDACCNHKGTTENEWAYEVEALLGTIMGPVWANFIGATNQYVKHLDPSTMTLPMQYDSKIMCKIMSRDGEKIVSWDELESHFKNQ